MYIDSHHDIWESTNRNKATEVVCSDTIREESYVIINKESLPFNTSYGSVLSCLVGDNPTVLSVSNDGNYTHICYNKSNLPIVTVTTRYKSDIDRHYKLAKSIKCNFMNNDDAIVRIKLIVACELLPSHIISDHKRATVLGYKIIRDKHARIIALRHEGLLNAMSRAEMIKEELTSMLTIHNISGVHG